MSKGNTRVFESSGSDVLAEGHGRTYGRFAEPTWDGNISVGVFYLENDDPVKFSNAPSAEFGGNARINGDVVVYLVEDGQLVIGDDGNPVVKETLPITSVNALVQEREAAFDFGNQDLEL